MNLKQFFPLCLLILLAGQSFGQTPVWTQMSGSPSGTTRHDDMVFINPTTGWSARGRGGIFKTTNAGNTWSQVLTNTATHFRCIGFLSESNGFAGNLGVGSYDTSVTDTNVLYQTTNGGVNWSVVPGLNETGMKGFCAMYVLDAQHIYGGGRVRGPAHFVKSEDGGTNWTVLDLTAAGIMGGIMDVYFKDPLNGFVVGMDTNAYVSNCNPPYYGRIAKTTDGGATWTAVADTGRPCSYFWKMSWPTPDVGYTSLQQNGSANNLIFYKTIDGGNTWISNGIPYATIGISSFTLLQGIGFVSANEGWVGGPSPTSPLANNFLHTTNGGVTWTPEGYTSSQSINRIRFYENFGIASGAKLHIYKVPLAIAAQPQNQTNSVGSTAMFNVTAHGTAPLVFQWRFNGTNIFGATTNSLSITNVQAGDAGDYDVVVSDYSGSVTSAVATLTLEGVSVAPNITSQPQSKSANPGNNVTFNVSASGTQPLHYEWRFNNVPINDETNSALALNNVTTNQSGGYSVLVTNSAGAVTSQVAVLNVNATIQPGGLGTLWTLAPGSRSYLTVASLPNERGLAYNSLTRRLVLVSRLNPNVHVLNADTGADLHQLSVSNVSGGTYALLMTGVANDGVVYAGNLTTNGSTTNFKLYRWANDNSGTTSTVAFSGNPTPGNSQRWGDTLDVRGEGTNTQIIMGSRSGTNIAVLATTDGTNFTSQGVNVSGVSGGAFGLGIAFGEGNTFWGKVNGSALRQVSFDLGTVLRTHANPDFPNAIAPIGVNTVLNLLGGINIGASGNQFRLYDLTTNNATPVFLGSANFATDNDNTGSGTGAVDFGGDRVFALGANNGILAMQIVPTNLPLAIVAQPQSQTNVVGSTATFNVAASGTAPLVYQWRFNGTNIAGANTNFHSITNVQATNAGGYDVVVGDFSGTITSAVATLTVELAAIPPDISVDPQDQTVNQGASATFTVSASGTAPLGYQWQFNSANISGATNSSFTRFNVQPADEGNYRVIVTNSAGGATSSVATLTVLLQTNILFQENFDSYTSPSIVTTVGTTNGYKIVYRSVAAPVDFKAIFGFDYSTVTYPTSIPSSPNSTGGTTRGLYLTVNKDATAGAAAVNLYPTNQFFSGDFALKFDMWINWANPDTSTEHTLFGINHSGIATNRVGQLNSDGLFFAVAGDDDTTTSQALRDYSVFRGGGSGTPILMTTANTTFGPAPLLSPLFENYEPGFTNLFPSQTIPGYGTTPPGTAGLRWINAEVRQQNNLVTWFLNGTIIAQYTNTFAYTNGNILLGYNDHFNSIGDSNNFVVLDNIRVETFIPAPVTILSPQISGNGFSFSFATEWGASYIVEKATALTPPNWTTYTNVSGNGALNTIHVPVTNNMAENYFRVIQP